MILRRLPDSRFSEVLPLWRGQTAVILAGGPSLTREQVRLVEIEHKLERVKCAVVNDAYLLAPWADLQYAADREWHRWHTEGIAKPLLGLSKDEVREAWARFGGQRCTIKNSNATLQDDRVHMLQNKSEVEPTEVFSFDPRSLVSGRNGGFQTLNLVALAGATTIILLGYDAREGQPVSHWHGEHPRKDPDSAYQEFRRAFSAAENTIRDAGIRVINSSPGTAINSFEKLPLAEALAEAQVRARKAA